MATHLVTSAVQGTLLFRTHLEARNLWLRVLREVPDLRALCLMPDHVHLLHDRDERLAFGAALRAYARWRNAHRGTRGAVFKPQPRSEGVGGVDKLRRTERYIHLNPCRARLVSDPLAWVWSTHRDRVGLAVPCVRTPVADPQRFHQYMSADPSVHVDGSTLPQPSDTLQADDAGFDAVRRAVSEASRMPPSGLALRGPARTLWAHSLRCLTTATVAQVAGELGLSRRAVQAVPIRWNDTTRTIARMACDPRFPGLHDRDLRGDPGWHRYRHRP